VPAHPLPQRVDRQLHVPILDAQFLDVSPKQLDLLEEEKGEQ
jgi:hypothetical protein